MVALAFAWMICQWRVLQGRGMCFHALRLSDFAISLAPRTRRTEEEKEGGRKGEDFKVPYQSGEGGGGRGRGGVLSPLRTFFARK